MPKKAQGQMVSQLNSTKQSKKTEVERKLPSLFHETSFILISEAKTSHKNYSIFDKHAYETPQ